MSEVPTSNQPELRNTDPSLDSARALDWPRLLELAEEQARTFPAKQLLKNLADPKHWARDVAHARILQLETQESAPLLDRDGLWGPLADLEDPQDALESLFKGSVLELADLALLRRWLYAADSWVQTPRDEIRGERIKKAILLLSDPSDPIRILDRVLTPEGELSERASPKLAQFFQEIRRLKREISATLDTLVKNLNQKGLLQESFTDVRDGRYVIPVKISHQNEVEGTIYEASASRQTVFIEPKEIAHLNQRLRQQQNELIQETFRILQETSEKIKPFGTEIQGSVLVLTHWDAVQARARLGRRYSGKAIQVSDEHEEQAVRLRQTAHPLLWWTMNPAQIIRNEIDFGDPTRTLLITGPNTGGKTVLLKTLGLAGVCARTGFPFPASETPIVPFFDSFFADLGDAQSIERHISSFSGHVLQFKRILEKMTPKSLVLLDELNTATDPEEGAALGRAFLETVMARGAMVVSTTHDPHLKALAVSDERIMNASMAFDESARTPTYRMLLGVPGRSRAIETAERLGIPADVIAVARSYLTREHKEFERLLAKLENDTHQAEKLKREAQQLHTEAERMKKEWTEKTGSQVGEMLDRTRQKLRRVLEQAQDEVRASVKKLDELKNRRDVDTTRGSLNQSFAQAASRIETALEEEAPQLSRDLKDSIPAAPVAAPTSEDEVKVGTAVRIAKWKSTGTVLELLAQKKVKVQMGSMQMTLALSDVEALPKSPTPGAQTSTHAKKSGGGGFGPRFVDQDRPSAPASTIDLRGTRFDDAMSKLEHYLDQAFRSGGLKEVTIVHGLGTGAIREGTRKLLGELPYIKEYRDGGLGAGGSGATIVEFDL